MFAYIPTEYIIIRTTLWMSILEKRDQCKGGQFSASIDLDAAEHKHIHNVEPHYFH